MSITSALSKLLTKMGGTPASGDNTDELLNKIGDAYSGGGGGSSDWNASEGEPGYILNRPFYEEPTRVLYDGETTFDRLGSYIAARIAVLGVGEINYPADTGNTFSITVGETVYTFDDNTPIDPDYHTPRNGNCMFLCKGDSGGTGFIIALFGQETGFTTNVKIEKTPPVTVIKKIDEKYLPASSTEAFYYFPFSLQDVSHE